MLPYNVRNFSQQIGKTTVQVRLSEWINQAVENRPLIREQMKSGKAQHIGQIPKEGEPKPLLFVSSGASLDFFGREGVLKSLSEVMRCATTGSQAINFIYYTGRVPDFVVVSDAGACTLRELGGDKNNPYHEYWKKSTLISNPFVYPGTLRYWPGKIYYYLEYSGSVAFLRETQKILYPDIQVEVDMAGSCTNMALQIFDFIGYEPLYQCAFDLGYVGGVLRAQDYRLVDGTWKTDGHRPIVTQDLLIGHKGLRTSTVLVSYKENFMLLWRNLFFQVLMVAPYMGIIDEVPARTGPDIVKDPLDYTPMDKDEILTVTGQYLESIGISTQKKDAPQEGILVENTETFT